MSKGTLSIHSENILPIIKQWLYSDKDIFLRELISNACDAVQKVRLLEGRDEATPQEEHRIDVRIDKDSKKIFIEDTGIGMNAQEIEQYIAQLAFSGAEEFVKKYQENENEGGIIGHFGLGFYSSFMVSRLVEIDSKSYRENEEAAYWSCDGSSEYTIDQGKREKQGTIITLNISDEDSEYLEEPKLKEILKKHCLFFSVPIYLNDNKINEREPLWTKAPSELTDEDYKSFFRYLYPTEPDPIFWIHLNVDYPFHLKGILYFPKVNQRFDFSKPAVNLYCNQVFVSDQCKDIIPEYLSVLRGVIDSPDIPLNVSRSTLQMDRTVRQLSSHISKKVADRLLQWMRSDKKDFTNKWKDLETIVKLGILQDEKFYEKVKEALLWQNDQEEWTTIEEYLERNKEKSGEKIYYMPHDANTESAFIDLYKQKGIEVLAATHFLDTPLTNFLETKIPNAKFFRIDGAIDDAILDKSKEKNVLGSDGKSQAATIAEAFSKLLDRNQLKVEAKSLASSELPAFIMMREEIRRMRDYLSLSSGQHVNEIGDEHTLVINTNHPMIEQTVAIRQEKPELAKSMAEHLYELSLLSQRELKPTEINGFIKRSTQLLSELASAKSVK